MYCIYSFSNSNLLASVSTLPISFLSNPGTTVERQDAPDMSQRLSCSYWMHLNIFSCEYTSLHVANGYHFPDKIGCLHLKDFSLKSDPLWQATIWVDPEILDPAMLHAKLMPPSCRTNAASAVSKQLRKKKHVANTKTLLQTLFCSEWKLSGSKILVKRTEGYARYAAGISIMGMFRMLRACR